MITAPAQPAVTRLAAVLPLLDNCVILEPLLPELYALQFFQAQQIMWHPNLPQKFEPLRVALTKFYGAERLTQTRTRNTLTNTLHWASRLLRLGGTLQICGARGTGKTLLSYILLLDIMRQHSELNVVWIHTQASIFDVDRIAKIATSAELDRMEIKCAFNLIELDRIIAPLLAEMKPVIVVIDSLSLLMDSVLNDQPKQPDWGEGYEMARSVLRNLTTLASLAPVIYVTTAVVTDHSPSRFAANKFGLPWHADMHCFPDNAVLLSSGRALFGDKEAFVIDKEVKGGRLKTGILEVIQCRDGGTRGTCKAFAMGDHDLFLLE